ncbi:MAG: hypothetical protein ACI9S8_001747 [Chlamydiales bacterium]|jgi:hypothetical protein
MSIISNPSVLMTMGAAFTGVGEAISLYNQAKGERTASSFELSAKLTQLAGGTLLTTAALSTLGTAAAATVALGLTMTPVLAKTYSACTGRRLSFAERHMGHIGQLAALVSSIALPILGFSLTVSLTTIGMLVFPKILSSIDRLTNRPEEELQDSRRIRREIQLEMGKVHDELLNRMYDEFGEQPERPLGRRRVAIETGLPRQESSGSFDSHPRTTTPPGTPRGTPRVVQEDEMNRTQYIRQPYQETPPRLVGQVQTAITPVYGHTPYAAMPQFEQDHTSRMSPFQVRGGQEYSSANPMLTYSAHRFQQIASRLDQMPDTTGYQALIENEKILYPGKDAGGKVLLPGREERISSWGEVERRYHLNSKFYYGDLLSVNNYLGAKDLVDMFQSAIQNYWRNSSLTIDDDPVMIGLVKCFFEQEKQMYQLIPEFIKAFVNDKAFLKEVQENVRRVMKDAEDEERSYDDESGYKLASEEEAASHLKNGDRKQMSRSALGSSMEEKEF